MLFIYKLLYWQEYINIYIQRPDYNNIMALLKLNEVTGMDDIIFTKEEGTCNKGEIVIYALSTCAFCKKALKFLRENSICFSYVYIDEFDFDKKSKIKGELKEKYKKDIGFPFLILDGTKVIVGFTEDEYKKYFIEG